MSSGVVGLGFFVGGAVGVVGDAGAGVLGTAVVTPGDGSGLADPAGSREGLRMAVTGRSAS